MGLISETDILGMKERIFVFSTTKLTILVPVKGFKISLFREGV